MWSRCAATNITALLAACATAEPVSYSAVPCGAAEFDVAFTSVGLAEDAHEAALSRRAAATCSGGYKLHVVGEEDVVGLDDTKNTPRKTTKAILTCEVA